MAFGILEDNKLSHVPGTSLLEDQVQDNNGVSAPTNSTAHLKHASGKNSDIILIPQPSDDPNDPLVLPSCIFLVYKIFY